MTRVTGVKSRQAILDLGATLDPYETPERLALFDQFGNPINLSGSVGIPPGGLTDQVLTKTSDDPFEVDWVDSSAAGGVPPGGAVNQILSKASATSFDVVWVDNAPPGFVEKFDFTPLTARYTEIENPGKLVTSGGKLIHTVANTSAGAIIVRPCFVPDPVQVLEFKTGAAPAGLNYISIIARYLNATNWLVGVINSWTTTQTVMEIYKFDEGVYTKFGATLMTDTGMAANKRYWLVFRVVDNYLRFEWWDRDPRHGGAALKLLSTDLIGADIAKFGTDVIGKVGMRIAAAGDTVYDRHVLLDASY